MVTDDRRDGPGRIRLVALDVDGTLLTSDHRVTEATRAAIDRVRARGVEVLLATSRAACALRTVLDALGLLEPAVFVSCQGALLGSYDPRGRLVIDEQHPAPLTSARVVVQNAGAAGLSVHWFTGPHWYVSGLDATVEQEAAVVEARPEVRDLGAEGDGPDKLMLISPTDDVSSLRAVQARLPPDLTAHVSNPRYLEITRSGIDKGSAVREYCRRNDIAARSVLAIGDGPNDLGLFAFAGTSIAPANARPEVQGAATALTTSNDDEGVARALDRHLP